MQTIHSKYIDIKSIRHRGFTLIELLIVLAIIGIMASVAYPNMRDFIRQSSVRDHANDAVFYLKFLRAQAVQNNASIEMSFDYTPGIWTAISKGICNDPTSRDCMPKFDINKDGEFITKTNSAGIEFRSNGTVGVETTIQVCHSNKENQAKNSITILLKQSGSIELSSIGTSDRSGKISASNC